MEIESNVSTVGTYKRDILLMLISFDDWINVRIKLFATNVTSRVVLMCCITLSDYNLIYSLVKWDKTWGESA